MVVPGTPIPPVAIVAPSSHTPGFAGPESPGVWRLRRALRSDIGVRVLLVGRNEVVPDLKNLLLGQNKNRAEVSRADRKNRRTGPPRKRRAKVPDRFLEKLLL